LTHVKKIETEPKLHDKSERKKSKPKSLFLKNLKTLPFCLGKNKLLFVSCLKSCWKSNTANNLKKEKKRKKKAVKKLLPEGSADRS